MGVATPHLAQIGPLPEIECWRVVLGGGEQIVDLGGGKLLVHDQAQRRDLFGPGRRAARRHHHRAVPIEHTERLFERAEATEAGLQLLVGGHRDTRLRR